MDAPHGTRKAVYRCAACNAAIEVEVPETGIPFTPWHRHGDPEIAKAYPDAVETPPVYCPNHKGKVEMTHLEGATLADIFDGESSGPMHYSCAHGASNSPCVHCHYVPGHIVETKNPDGKTVTRTYVEGYMPPVMPDDWHLTYQAPVEGLTDKATFRNA